MLKYKSKARGASNIQPKLKIGQPGDKYEQEADAVSDRVMRMTESNQMQMQPMEEEEEMMQPKLRMQPMEEEEEMLQMQPLEEEEEMLQPKSDGGIQQASASLSSRLYQSKGGGSSLPDTTNQAMSQAFGTDFSNVRVHTGNDSIQMNQDLNARAFTHGSDVYFNKGEYNPNSSNGKRLLAHELTHVVQQTGTKSQVNPKIQMQNEEEENQKRLEYESLQKSLQKSSEDENANSGTESVEGRTRAIRNGITPDLQKTPDIQKNGCSPRLLSNNGALSFHRDIESTWRSYVKGRCWVTRNNNMLSVRVYNFAKVYYGLWYTSNTIDFRTTVDLSCEEVDGKCHVYATERGGSVLNRQRSPVSGAISIGTASRSGGTQVALTVRYGAAVGASGAVSAGVGPVSAGVSFPDASLSYTQSMGTWVYDCA